MPDGTQKALPFPRHAALTNPPDAHFPLAAERLRLRQKVESIQRLIEYQGDGPSALRVILAIKEDQISHLNAYIAALEKEVRRLAEPPTPAAPPPKRRRKTSGATPAQGPRPPRSLSAGAKGSE
jgi:hypothetical protein